MCFCNIILSYQSFFFFFFFFLFLGPKSNGEIDKIVTRLYETKTKSIMSEGEVTSERAQARKVTESELSSIIERLHTTPTKSSSGYNPGLK